MIKQEDGLSITKCNGEQLEFHGFGRRKVVAKFDGDPLSSDGGGLLLRETERHTGILHRFAQQFVDYRDPDAIEHTVKDLVSQRVLAIALGYEDLNDHHKLRRDPLLAMLVGKADPTGQTRQHKRDRGKVLASASTLNRLELTQSNATAAERYKKIVAMPGRMDRLLVDVFMESYDEPSEEIWLDLDTTDDPLHGQQEGRFFHGYYGHYCYLPLYIFCGEHLLCARLRESNIDGAAGSIEELEWIVAQMRERWPDTRIVIRGDSGFCREAIMAWCESNKVAYVLGLAKNKRLKERLSDALEQARKLCEKTKKAAHVFEDFRYQTRKTWSRERRVVGKAEQLPGRTNPRFVVTDLSPQRMAAQPLYEELYCARGDMENRIKEQQLDLFADRTSSATMRANQIRLYFSSFAYVVVCALRRLGLKGTETAKAQCGTIRLKLFKIGARFTITVRKVWLSLAENYPYAALFHQVHANLRRLPRYHASG